MSVGISIDPARCLMHGDCTVTAPDLFELDEEAGHAIVLQSESAEALRSQAELAVDRCPNRAITMTH